MGRDNIFWKNKAKNEQALQRRQDARSAYEKILIVCEGKKSEPIYLESVKRHFKLNNANIEILGKGSDPQAIFEHAQEMFEYEATLGDPYDKVYCVFDKDQHANYQGTLESIRTAKPENTFIAIPSIPCFEYWLLLHYIFSTKTYSHISGNSASQQMVKALKKYIPNYEKGKLDYYCPMLIDKLETAITHSEKALKEAEKSQTDNPSSYMHVLVSHLKRLANKV